MEYQVPWILHMKYDRKKQEMTVIFSERYVKILQLESNMLTLNDEQIKEFIHKYDYRKLIYFTTETVSSPFDTLIRFKKPNEKSYIRTNAVCHIDRKNLLCVHFEEKDIFNLQHKMSEQHLMPMNIQVAIDQLDDIERIETNYQVSKFVKQLNSLISRTM